MTERRDVSPWETWGLWLVVVPCLIIGVVLILPPRAPTGDDPGAISVDRALEHVDAIAREPHVMGTPEIDRVREYLIATLSAAGLEPETLTIEAPDYFSVSGGTVDVIDVLTRVKGTGDGSAILLMAHYDTAPATPGANDNSAAVAALLEVARTLVSGSPPPNDVIFLFTDGEEPTPRFGAWGFVEYHPWFDDVVLAVNFEGIAAAGPSMLVEMSGPDGELISRLANAVPAPVAFSFLTQTADLIGGAATDFDVFRDAGVPGYNFTYMRGTSIYHSPRDSIANLNVNGLAHHGSLALGIAGEFGAPQIGQSDDDAVFFSVPFRFVVRYSTTWAMVSLLAGVVLVASALRSRRIRDGAPVRSLLSGSGVVLLAMLGSVAVSTLLWIGIVNLRPDMGVIEGYAYLAALVGLTAGGWHLARRSARRGNDVDGGLLAVVLVVALVFGLLLPAFGYLFVWPAIAGGIAELIATRLQSYGARLVAVATVALTACVVLVPAVDAFFHFASPRPGNPDSEMPATIVVSMFLVFVAIGLIAGRINGADTSRSA